MKIKKILELVKGDVVVGEKLLEKEVNSACASDMMSDVLAFVKDQAVLVTGLCNPQVMRTAEMMDMCCVVLVRGKTPDPMMVRLAEEYGIVVITSPMRMFAASGVLYEAGLKPED